MPTEHNLNKPSPAFSAAINAALALPDGQRGPAIVTAVVDYLNPTCSVQLRDSAGVTLATAAALATADTSVWPNRVRIGGFTSVATFGLNGTLDHLVIEKPGGAAILTSPPGSLLTDPVQNLTVAMFTGLTADSAYYFSVPAGVDTFNPNEGGGGGQIDGEPAYLVIEDWTNPASPATVGQITFNTLLGSDSFSDAALAADCPSWTEWGPTPSATLPELGGIRFGAIKLSIPQGGVYTAPAYRVHVMMHAMDLDHGILGDPAGKRTYALPHKIKIYDIGNNLLKTIELHDGLPINAPSLKQWPMDFTRNIAEGSVTSSYNFFLTDSEVMRPHVPCTGSYAAFFGPTPLASSTVRNKIPRVRLSTFQRDGIMLPYVYTGTDVHYAPRSNNGNGNSHTEIIPEWPWTRTQITTTSDATYQATHGIPASNQIGLNWQEALNRGWRHEPGAYCGITRRGGPGGQRVDRHTLPQEPLQAFVQNPTATRYDGTPWVDIARNFAEAHASYPGYLPVDLRTQRPMNLFASAPIPPTTTGPLVKAVDWFYNATGIGDPNTIRIYDTQGGDWLWIAGKTGEYAGVTSNTNDPAMRHPRAGWCPDTEHNNRVGANWAAMLWADPLFARMADHINMESWLMAPWFKDGYESDWNLWGTASAIQKPLSYDFEGYGGSQITGSRTMTLPFIVATLQWWTATQNSTYNRAALLAKIRLYLVKCKALILDNVPGTPTTSQQHGYKYFGGGDLRWFSWNTGQSNEEAGSGWGQGFSLATLYTVQWLYLLRASGLDSILKTTGTSEEQAAAQLILGKIEAQIAFYGEITATAPWAIRVDSSGYGFPFVLLRRADQGAVQNDITTIPQTLAAVQGYNPAYRTDGKWWLLSRSSGVPYTWNNPYVLKEGNSVRGWRWQAASFWADFLLPPGSTRDAMRALIAQRIGELHAWGERDLFLQKMRMACPQNIPALGVNDA